MGFNERKAIVLLLKVVLSALYILIFVSVPSLFLRDRLPYEYIAKNSKELIEYYGTSLLMHEPIFLYFNFFLINFLNENVIPYVFVGIITLFLMVALSRLSASFVLFLLGMVSFFYVPSLFHLQLVTLRQGLATVVFLLIVIFSKNNKISLFGVFLTIFIHASFVLFFCIYALYLFFNNIIGGGVRSNIVVAFIVSFLLFFGFALGSLVGLYQLNYIETEVTGFLGFFLYLVIFLYLLFIRNDNSFKSKRVYDLSIIFMLIGTLCFFTVPFLGRYSITFFLFVFLTLVQKRGGINIVFILALISLFYYKFYSGEILNVSMLGNDLTVLGFPWSF